MLFTSSASLRYVKSGALLFALQAYLFVFGLSLFRMGLWPMQEPRLLALFLLSAVTCGWLFLGLAKGWLSVPRPFPLYLALVLGWVGWQLAVTVFFAASPWRSWFGNMYGEGAAYYLCVGLTTFLAYALWPDPRHRRWVLYAVMSALALMILLQQLPTYSTWRPLYWPDYLAFLTGFVWVALLLSKPDMPVRIQLGLALLACECLIVSQNKSAWMLLPVAAIALLLCLRVQERNVGKSLPPVPRWARVLATLLCLLPLAYTFQTRAPSADQHHSIEQRVHMNAIGFNALYDEPKRLITGKGWNDFANDHFKYAVFESVRLFRDGQYKPNAESVFGSSAHSHNQPLEALLALGIPGALLWFSLAITVLWRLPDFWFWRVAPIHTALVMISYFWFPLSFFCAFVALYWAALSHTQTSTMPPQSTRSNQASVATLLLLPLVFLLLWSGWQQLRAMSYGQWLQRVIYAPYQPYTTEALLEDLPRGGERLRAIAGDYLDDLSQRFVLESKEAKAYTLLKGEPQMLERLRKKTPDGPEWIARLTQLSKDVSHNPHVGVHVGALDLMLPYFLQLYAMDAPYDPARAMAFDAYPEAVVRIATTAPRREDLATPYLYHLEQSDDQKTLASMIERLLAANPQHRTARWLKGKHLTHEKATRAEGYALMRGALNEKVDLIYPIRHEERWDVIWNTGNDVLTATSPAER